MAAARGSMMAAAPRSTFVTVLAWIFIVITGFMTLIGILQNVMLHFMMPALRNAPPPRGDEPALFRLMFENFQVIFLAVMLLCMLALAASIGLLMRRNWARVLFITMMGVGIAWNVVGLGLMAWMARSMPPMPGDGQAPPGFAVDTMFSVMLAVNAAMIVAFCLLFGWIIKRLLAPQVRAEFLPAAGPAP